MTWQEAIVRWDGEEPIYVEKEKNPSEGVW
jgi:hypothetical protein